MTDPERDMLAKHIDNRSFNRIVVTNMTEGIRLINIYEAKLLSLTSNQKKLFDALSDYKKLSSADMEVLIKNIDKVNVEGIAEGDFKKIIK